MLLCFLFNNGLEYNVLVGCSSLDEIDTGGDVEGEGLTGGGAVGDVCHFGTGEVVEYDSLGVGEHVECAAFEGDIAFGVDGGDAGGLGAVGEGYRGTVLRLE